MTRPFDVKPWLFDVKPDQIDVVVHPQSIVHSCVQFEDGSIEELQCLRAWNVTPLGAGLGRRLLGDA